MGEIWPLWASRAEAGQNRTVAAPLRRSMYFLDHQGGSLSFCYLAPGQSLVFVTCLALVGMCGLWSLRGYCHRSSIFQRFLGEVILSPSCTRDIWQCLETFVVVTARWGQGGDAADIW